MTDLNDVEFNEPENTDTPAEQEIIINEPVLTFYKYDTDGFYLGTTWQSGENTTDVPLEYESGYWYFFNGTDWDKVKIPESLSEITLDLELTEEATNYEKTLVSLAQRLAAEYEGNDYTLVITDNHYQVIHVSEQDLLKDQYRLEIQQLKKQLSDTDYKAIKYAEGQISEEDYAAIRAERQACRDRINWLEEQL